MRYSFFGFPDLGDRALSCSCELWVHEDLQRLAPGPVGCEKPEGLELELAERDLELLFLRHLANPSDDLADPLQA